MSYSHEVENWRLVIGYHKAAWRMSQTKPWIDSCDRCTICVGWWDRLGRWLYKGCASFSTVTVCSWFNSVERILVVIIPAKQNTDYKSFYVIKDSFIHQDPWGRFWECNENLPLLWEKNFLLWESYLKCSGWWVSICLFGSDMFFVSKRKFSFFGFLYSLHCPMVISYCLMMLYKGTNIPLCHISWCSNM